MYEPVGRGKEDVFVRVATSIMSRFDRFVQGGGWAAGVDFRDGILGHRPKMMGKLVKFRQVQYCRKQYQISTSPQPNGQQGSRLSASSGIIASTRLNLMNGYIIFPHSDSIYIGIY